MLKLGLPPKHEPMREEDVPACPSFCELQLLDKQTSRLGISEPMELACFKACQSQVIFASLLKIGSGQDAAPTWEVGSVLKQHSSDGIPWRETVCLTRETSGGPCTTNT